MPTNPDSAALITFRAGGMDLAIPLRSVSSILRRSAAGGREPALALVDVSRRLDSPRGAETEPTRVLEVRTSAGTVGLPVDEVLEIAEARLSRGSGLPRWAMALARVGSREVTVIEPDRLAG